MAKRKTKRVIIVSTFPRRECGIQVFNTDEVNSLKYDGIEDFVFVPITEDYGKRDYEPWVLENFGCEINQKDPDSFVDAANYINQIYKPGDVVLAQHEFGFWAPTHEEDCAVDFASVLSGKVPMSFIFHTLFTQKNEQKDKVLLSLQKKINLGIGLTPTGLNLLRNKYGFGEDQSEYIPHGVPDTVILESHHELKRRKGLIKRRGGERRVVTTIGFLSRGKCLEDGIAGFTLFKHKNPKSDPIYIIEGETPQSAYRHEGHKYIYECADLATFLGNRVKFMCVDGEYKEASERFKGNDRVEVCLYEEAKQKMSNNSRFFQGIDIAITPRYLETNDLLREVETGDLSLVTNGDEGQVCSGQIYWYTSRGRVVAATASPCAKDFYDQGMGLLMEFRNPRSVAHTLEHFYNCPDEMENRVATAVRKSREFAWPNVGHITLDALDSIVEDN